MLCLVTQLCLTLCDPTDYIPLGSSVHGILQARILEWVAIPFSRKLSRSGIEPGSPALQVNCLLSEPPGKLQNTLVSSLSLLQGIFPIQELNWGLLHCRQIPHQFNYPGSKPQERTPLFPEVRIHVFRRIVILWRFISMQIQSRYPRIVPWLLNKIFKYC